LDVALAYPVNFFELVLKGNAAYIGKTLDLGGIGLYGNYYREWAFGVSKIMDEGLTLGIKAKILFGKANINTSRSDLSLSTSDPNYYLQVQSQMEAKASPLLLDMDSTGRLNKLSLPADMDIVSFLLNRKNKGFAMDFGFIYKYDDQITFSGSLLDIGFIRYSYNTAIVTGNADYQYKGFQNAAGSSSSFILNQIRADLRNSYSFSNSSSPYTKFLPPKLYLGATYELLPTVNTGLMLRNELYNGKLRSSATGSLNAWYKNYLSGSISWSYINGSALNFGAGIGLRTPQAGLYVISDNVYGAFKYKSARLLNIRFGINLLFGCATAPKKSAVPCSVYDDLKPAKGNPTKWKKKAEKESGLFK
jgi:hypothetical protein